MTLGEMLTRIRYNIGDPNSELYTDAEISAAINNNKDAALATIRAVTDQFPQAIASLSFDIGEKEEDLPTDFLALLRVEWYETVGSVPSKRRVIDFNNQDEDEKGAFYVRRVDAQTVYLGRYDANEALTVACYYIPDVADTSNITASTTSSFLFGPPPTNNLIVVETTIQLLAARKRNIADTFMLQRNTFMQLMHETLGKMNVASPRHVHYMGY